MFKKVKIERRHFVHSEKLCYVSQEIIFQQKYKFDKKSFICVI